MTKTSKRTLNLETREEFGKGASRRLRVNGRIPAVIYGNATKPVHASIELRELLIFSETARFNTLPFDVELAGEKYHVLPRNLERDPVTDRPIHLDLLHVNDDQRVSVPVNVRFTNRERSPGLKRGGTLNIVRRHLELVGTTKDVPSVIIIDLTGKQIGDSIHISHVPLPAGVEPVISDRDFTIATIVGRKGDKKETEATEAAEGEEEAAEGDKE